MAIAGLILLVSALALFAASLLGVMPAGPLLGSFVLIAAVFAIGMAASEGGRLHLRHRRVR
jgi:hypothetical protein